MPHLSHIWLERDFASLVYSPNRFAAPCRPAGVHAMRIHAGLIALLVAVAAPGHDHGEVVAGVVGGVPEVAPHHHGGRDGDAGQQLCHAQGLKTTRQ